MDQNERLMQEAFDDEWEELWIVIMSTKGRYELSKLQARLLQEAFNQGLRAVNFDSFTIPVSFIAEFYREKRWKKGQMALPQKATEEAHVPMSPEKFAKFKEEVYRKIGKPMPKK